MTLLCTAKTHYNSLHCNSHGEHRFSAPGSTTPGRCKVAAIFYYKDNLIHIAVGGLRGSCCSGSRLESAKYIPRFCPASVSEKDAIVARDDVIF